MKHVNIKTLLIGLALATAVSSIYSCSKGPAGPAGPQGPVGTANVKVYKWGAKSTSSSTSQSITYKVLANGLKPDSVVHYFYASNSFSWYLLPGTFIDGVDFFRGYLYKQPSEDSLEFYFERVPRLSADPTKTTAITFNQAKAVIIPTGTFTNLRTSINWDDYNDVKSKLNIKDEDEILVK